MNFEELRDRLKEFLQTKWQQFQDTPTYAQFKEKYDDMPVAQQRLLKIGAVLVVLLAILFPPLSWYQSSTTNLASFEDDRGLLKDVLHVGRQMQETPEVIPQLSTGEVKQRVDGVVASLQLVPEQIKGSVEGPFPIRPGSHLIPSQLSAQGVELTLDKLNIRQVIDLVYRLQALKESGIRVFSMDMGRAMGETHFFTVHLQVGNLLSTAGKPDSAAKAIKK